MFTYKLRLADGTSADPPAITLAVPNMRVGDTIPLRRARRSRVPPSGSRGRRGSDADRRGGHNGRRLR